MVIGIIIILAGIAIPNFNRAKERALTKEAIANLKLIAAAEKVYRMEYLTYYGPEDDIGDINSYLRLYFTNEINWNYEITAAAADTFTATATRQAGPYFGCEYTIIETTPGDPPQAGPCP
jgi:type II secretory pathway pseudopilin PulG